MAVRLAQMVPALPTSCPGRWRASFLPAAQQRPFAFSDPFIMRVGPEETVGQLRQRVQVRVIFDSGAFLGCWQWHACRGN